MRRYIILQLCFLLLLAGCSMPYQHQHVSRTLEKEVKQLPPHDFFSNDISIVAIGDSLTEGVGDIDQLGGYIHYLKNLMEQEKVIKSANFVNFGVKGNRTDQLLKRLDDEHVTESLKETDMIIITIGGNDVMQVLRENLLGLSLNKFHTAQISYSQRLEKILNKVINYNNHAKIFLVGIYNPFIRWFSDIKEMDIIVDNWNQASEDIVAKYDQVTFVPVADIFFNNEENLLYTDYFHPNNRGYELIAERIFTIVKETGSLEVTLDDQSSTR